MADYKLVTTTARYYGLAADTKPTLTAADIGREAFELDTDTKYIWDGAAWQAQSTLGSVTVSGSGATATEVQGNIANDAADSGNPVKVGGKAISGTPPVVTANDRVNAWLDLYGRQVVTLQAPGDTGDIFNSQGLITQGTASHDAAILGKPVRLGARALTSNYTAVATGDAADLISTLVGALINKPYSIPEGDWSYAAAASGIANTTTAVTIAAAAGAGLRNYITGVQLSSDALGAATEFAIRDGAAGTVLWRKKIGTAGIVNGINYTFASPLKSTANTLLEVVTLTASITGAVYFNAQGYIAP